MCFLSAVAIRHLDLVGRIDAGVRLRVKITDRIRQYSRLPNVDTTGQPVQQRRLSGDLLLLCRLVHRGVLALRVPCLGSHSQATIHSHTHASYFVHGQSVQCESHLFLPWAFRALFHKLVVKLITTIRSTLFAFMDSKT